jgi:hypothetical protein
VPRSRSNARARRPSASSAPQATDATRNWPPATDGQTTNVPDTNEVSVRQTARGTTQDRTIHVARIDGIWRWFTDCSP